MQHHLRALLPAGLLLAVLAAGCGSVGDSLFNQGATSAASTTGAGEGGGGAGATTGAGGAGTTTAATTGVGGAGGGLIGVVDPNGGGPYLITEIDDTVKVPATGHDVPIHCAFPAAGPTEGPFPVVVVAHGFQIPASQYQGYVKRLASFGFVALTADFPAGFIGTNNVANAKDLLGALDWAASAPELAGKADADNAGMTGHSLGGKLSLLAATMDPRVKASIVLDPVDASMGCNPQDCPDVSEKLPGLQIPTAFLGETLDSTGSFQACAPAEHNYTTFWSAANKPSLEVTVIGANHMSFLDDVKSCGGVCNFCKPATAPNAEVVALARAYVVAFYQRWLKGDVAYDTYLTGDEAVERYVKTGKAELKSK